MVANPFLQLIDLEGSTYSKYDGKKLIFLNRQDDTSVKINLIHDQFRSTVLSPYFSCAGAKTAFFQNTYRFALYKNLTSEPSTRLLCNDLFQFIQEQKKMQTNYSTFVACFEGPLPMDEDHFEDLLWKQLQLIHDLDHQFHKWNEEVSADTQNPNFSFSFGEKAFFVVGMHPASSRLARKFLYPCLVFNSHEQFNELKRINKYQHLQKVIRRNEVKLQGNINPSLSDFGLESEAKQYSGKYNGPKWMCPFFKND
ncbi:MAG: guanitoxin biosynthesis heme-dependent pre-guanitoxin N-hydroxylase GntA [Allomuricauda sp.]